MAPRRHPQGGGGAMPHPGGVDVDADEDDNGQADLEGVRHGGDVDNALGQHPLDSASDCPLGQPQPATDLAVGQSAVPLQEDDNLPVNRVDGRRPWKRIPQIPAPVPPNSVLNTTLQYEFGGVNRAGSPFLDSTP